MTRKMHATRTGLLLGIGMLVWGGQSLAPAEAQQTSISPYVAVRAHGASLEHECDFSNNRVTRKVRDCDSKERIGGGLGVGAEVAKRYVVELEYMVNQGGDYRSYWAPFNANQQVIKVGTVHTGLLNLGYKFGIGDAFSLTPLASAGWTHVEVGGLQAAASNFKSKTNDSFAWGAGLLLGYDFAKNMELQFGYRYVDLGEAESGISDFDPRDERFKGNLTAHIVQVGLKYKF